MDQHPAAPANLPKRLHEAQAPLAGKPCAEFGKAGMTPMALT